MKKIVLIMLATLLLGVLPSTVSADAWSMNNTPGRFFVSEFAHVNAALSKFEGVLHAYSATKGNGKVNEQAASDNISASLESLTVALNEAYPGLSEEQQLAVISAYLPSSAQLQIFGRLPD